jgi:protoporphyrinogen oxidase
MRIGIIGAGISGLAAAFRLARRGHHVEVFQRESSTGGLIATFDLAGTRIEHFYHFLCAGDTGYFELCRELGLQDRIRFVKARTGFYYQGQCFGFTTALDLLRFTPIPFSQRVRFGIFALESRMRDEWTQLDEITAEPWLIDRLGRRAFDVIWSPLLSLKFGEYSKTISAAWVWHRIHRVARSKGRMGYLEGGSGFLLDSLMASLKRSGITIHPGKPVTGIMAEAGRVRGLRLQGGSAYECERIISTVPLPVVADLIPPGWEDYETRLRAVRYIGVACVALKLTRPVTPYFWLNVHDSSIPFNGIIEYTNLNRLAGEHIAYVPYYVPTDSPVYRMADHALIDQTWRGMKRIAPDLRDEDLVASHLSRAAYAQAICPTNFLRIIPGRRAPLGGLHLLDSVFLYPEDRTQSGNILKANECAEEIAKDG